MRVERAPESTNRSPQWRGSQNQDEGLEAVANGDEAAFARWMAHAEPKIRGSLRSFAGVVDTEAVLQETLLRAWQNAPRVVSDGKPNALLRLSLRIAKNLAITEVRRRRCVPVTVTDAGRKLETGSGADISQPPDPLLRSLIQHCRDRLPPQPRKALDMRLSSRGGHSDRVLAARAGMTKNTFLQNVTRARKLMASHLAESGVDLAVEMA